MNAKSTVVPEWEALKTEETRRIEDVLRTRFQTVDAYRYNSASIRLRIIDPSFKERPREDRDDLVEPLLLKLDEDTRADIMTLVLLYPGEKSDSFRAFITDEEFEHPSRSLL
ncbi:MAG: hypothetical protein WBC44_13465 [Planctomycetaceae bacterium]